MKNFIRSPRVKWKKVEFLCYAITRGIRFKPDCQEIFIAEQIICENLFSYGRSRVSRKRHH